MDAAVARYNAGPGNPAAEKTYVCSVIRNMVASGFGQWTPTLARSANRPQTLGAKAMGCVCKRNAALFVVKSRLYGQKSLG